jgi:hypothetical protein
MPKPKLLTVKKSKKPGKKWNFTFKSDTSQSKSKRTFTRSVGNSTRNNYTLHHNKTRRKHYLQRHKKNLNTGDPTRPGYISYYVLWGNSTSFEDNLKAYKKKFNL